MSIAFDDMETIVTLRSHFAGAGWVSERFEQVEE